MSRIHEIIACCKHDDAAENDNAPVHGFRCDGCRHWEKRKNENWQQIAECADVDQSTVSAKRPAARGKGFASDAFQEDATDGDDVGRDEGSDGEGDNGVESLGRPDVDE